MGEELLVEPQSTLFIENNRINGGVLCYCWFCSEQNSPEKKKLLSFYWGIGSAERGFFLIFRANSSDKKK